MKQLRPLLLIQAMLCLTMASYGQENRKLDSLLMELRNAAPKDQGEVLLKLCRYYYKAGDNLKTIEFASSGYNLSRTLGDSANMVRFGRLTGQLLSKEGKIDQALSTAKAVLPVSQRNGMTVETKRLLNSLGVMCINKGDYSQALKYAFQSLRLRQEGRDPQELGIAYNNLGLIYYKLEDNASAFEYYRKALSLKIKAGDRTELSKLLTNIALCQDNLDDPDGALISSMKALIACGAACSNADQAEIMFALGRTFRLYRNTKFEELYFRKSYGLALKANDKRYQLENLLALSKLQINAGRFIEAEESMSKAEHLALETSYDEILMFIYRTWGELYSKTGDFEKASDYRKKHADLSEKIFRGKTKELMRIQAEFNEHENRKTIQSQRLALALDKQLIDNRHMAIAFIGVILALLAGLMVIIWRKYVEKQKITVLLDQKVKARTEMIDYHLKILKTKLGDQREEHLSAVRQFRQQLGSIRGLINVIITEKVDIPAAQEARVFLAKTEENLTRMVESAERENGSRYN